jgi:putative colanic acid biosynthesis UDP-glucose lipid carrier transferase
MLQQRLIDLLTLVSIFAGLAWFLRQDLDTNYLVLLSLTILLFELLAQLFDLYSVWRTRVLWPEIGRLSLVWLSTLAALLMLAFVLKVSAVYSRRLLVLWAVATPTVMLASRVGRNRYERARPSRARSLAFFGSGQTARRMAEHLRANPWAGYKVLGVYEDREPGRVTQGGMALLGSSEALLHDARAGRIDEIYITLPMHAQRRIVELVNALSDTTVSVFVVPDGFIFDMMQASWSEVAGYPIISIYDTPFYGVDGSFKRLEDLLLASAIIVLISPVLLLIALGVKLSSPGPVLFRQRRYGLNGRIVEVWKFRTMTVAEDGEHVVQATRDDARVTRLGAVLRRHSLDELPQFFNVLQGRMSIVGPRPHAVAHNEQYRRMIHGYMVRHKVKPGITGWAQINGWRGETDTIEKMRKRVEFDLYYVRNWSFLFDLRIIALTVIKGFRSKNVY